MSHRFKIAARWRRGLAVAMLACLACPEVSAPQALRVHPKLMRIQPELLCVLCTLTVSATPASVSFSLTQGGTAAGSAPVVITTTMNGVTELAQLTLYGYFTTASAALTDGLTTTDNIPSSAVLGQMTTGTPTGFTPFTQSNPFGTTGGSLVLYSVLGLPSLNCTPITAVCRTDNLNLEINLASLPQLPAGTYNGTLILEAQAL